MMLWKVASAGSVKVTPQRPFVLLLFFPFTLLALRAENYCDGSEISRKQSVLF